MAFTYDLTTDAGKVRFNLGDTQENAGPRPDKRNFTDAEIDHLLSEEGSVVAATAFGFEILAGEWESYSLREKEGEAEYDGTSVADGYQELADKWRAKPGGGTSSNSLQAGVIALDFMEKGTVTSS